MTTITVNHEWGLFLDCPIQSHHSGILVCLVLVAHECSAWVSSCPLGIASRRRDIGHAAMNGLLQGLDGSVSPSTIGGLRQLWASVTERSLFMRA